MQLTTILFPNSLDENELVSFFVVLTLASF